MTRQERQVARGFTVQSRELMHRKYERVQRRVEWLPHFQQSQCRRCGAWLTELPTHALQLQDRANLWTLTWRCLGCRFQHSVRSGEPLEHFHPDPSVSIVTPGSMPPWSAWRLPRPVVSIVQRVSEQYAAASSAATLLDCPSVLDHDGVRRAPWGTYRGNDDDPTGVRLWLARLRYTPKNVLGATLVSVVAERAVLAAGAVFQKIRDEAPLLEGIAKSSAAGRCEYDRLMSTPALTAADAECGELVGPVIGHGRLSVPNRYEDWLLTQGAYPWLSRRCESLSRANIPAGTELLAGVVELADAILGRFALLHSADSQMDLLSDVTDLQHLMGLWRRIVTGRWEQESFTNSRRAKVPEPYWLKQWESAEER